MTKPEKPALTRWQEALLVDPDVNVLALGRQYVGGRSKGKSREEILAELSSFLSAEETAEAALGLLDGIDGLILGSLLVAGRARLEDLATTLSSDLSYRDLEYRLANLQERLLVFKAPTGEFEVAPQLVPGLASALDADRLFGKGGRASIDGPSPGEQISSVQELVLVVLALLGEGKDLQLKDGGLSARVRRRVLELTGGDLGAPPAVAFLLGVFLKTGVAQRREGSLSVDRSAAARLLDAAGEGLAFDLATGGIAGRGRALEAALGAFLAAGFVFTAEGFQRFCALAVLAEGRTEREKGSLAEDTAVLRTSLLALGLVESQRQDEEGALVCRPERVFLRWKAVPPIGEVPAFVVDGSGGIQVLPSASPRDLLFLVGTAELLSTEGGWRFRLTKTSARRAFAEGWSLLDLVRELERRSRRPLPQSLSWDLESWRTEHDSARLFRGLTLVLNKEAAELVERSKAFADLPHEVLGEGFYFFGSVPCKAIGEALEAIGLPSPSLRSGLGERRGGERSSDEEKDVPYPSGGGGPVPSFTANSGTAGGVRNLRLEPREARTNPADPRPALNAELERLVPDPQRRRRFEEMLERKLVYTVEQLRAMVRRDGKPARGERDGAGLGMEGAGEPSAAGLDFHGKLRLIQASFRNKYARLEVRWVSGDQSLGATLRPVSLRKTERDYELEGEDLSSGRPLTLRVGAMTYVGLKKGYYLGDIS